MQTRTRLAAVIIKDNKILLVKGPKRFKEYWTPGGRQEEGESDKETLSRELKEELGVDVVKSRFFKEYICDSPYVPGTKSIVRMYITKIKGEPKPSAEVTECTWMSRKDFENKKYPLVDITQEEIIPELIKESIF